jgi:predicted HTH transcriptional regulator
MRYTPIVAPAELPVVGETYETATLDLKAEVDDREGLELAKDVAAMANQFGGTILVGVVEGADGLLASWNPLTALRAAAIQTAYERAVMHFLSPRPRITALRIPVQGGECVAVNVEPYVDGVVGARADAKVNHVWRYPLRVGKETRWMTPEEVAIMTPQTRKALVMLDRMEPGDAVLKIRETLRSGTLMDQSNARFFDVDVADNIVRFRLNGDREPTAYPLDLVRTVYREYDSWIVVFDSFR